MNQKRRYLSYLLRLWQESSGDPPLWRASLERPQSEELRGFASLADLFAFLEEETGSSSRGLERRDDMEQSPDRFLLEQGIPSRIRCSLGIPQACST